MQNIKALFYLFLHHDCRLVRACLHGAHYHRIYSCAVTSAKYLNSTWRQVIFGYESCAHRVVYIVINVGDFICQSYDLPLQSVGNFFSGMA